MTAALDSGLVQQGRAVWEPLPWGWGPVWVWWVWPVGLGTRKGGPLIWGVSLISSRTATGWQMSVVRSWGGEGLEWSCKWDSWGNMTVGGLTAVVDGVALFEVMQGSCALFWMQVRVDGELTACCLWTLLDWISLLGMMLTTFGSSGTGSWREMELCCKCGIILFSRGRSSWLWVKDVCVCLIKLLLWGVESPDFTVVVLENRPFCKSLRLSGSGVRLEVSLIWGTVLFWPSPISDEVAAVVTVLSWYRKTMDVSSLGSRKGFFRSSVLTESGFPSPELQSCGTKVNLLHVVRFLRQRDSVVCVGTGTTWAKLLGKLGWTISGVFWAGRSGELGSLVWLLIRSLLCCKDILSMSWSRFRPELILERWSRSTTSETQTFCGEGLAFDTSCSILWVLTWSEPLMASSAFSGSSVLVSGLSAVLKLGPGSTFTSNSLLWTKERNGSHASFNASR